MSTGELLTRWTVRAALGSYAVVVALMLIAGGRQSTVRVARVLWTAGCLLYLAHVAAAFHVFHGWSHAAAYQETARQTGELFGPHWGGGLYFNYAFTAAWAADVAWWWLAGADGYGRRARWVAAALHAFMAFMAFNATVVFARGPTRWAAAGACAALVVLLGIRVLRSRRGGGTGVIAKL